ncbi:hypothetical protein J1C56_06690 [Aminobacter anthyllidis]|uniref:Uncharacterized protein n=1 Tax=Aminobacter anthyllidis TaxID=1035067 RepID=A0A9X1A8Z0_9HYPH|nr:hypothetical protein [Aminobacter anthyllidis]MBT1155276.1 hypothetical protein [Aminobacter anthyllidis]
MIWVAVRVIGVASLGFALFRYFVSGGLQVIPFSMVQGTRLSISQDRAGRLVSATSVANMIPNKALSRQTMVNRRASIGVFPFNGADYARLRLNGF